jgi:hypothetical protein
MKSNKLSAFWVWLVFIMGGVMSCSLSDKKKQPDTVTESIPSAYKNIKIVENFKLSHDYRKHKELGEVPNKELSNKLDEYLNDSLVKVLWVTPCDSVYLLTINITETDSLKGTYLIIADNLGNMQSKIQFSGYYLDPTGQEIFINGELNGCEGVRRYRFLNQTHENFVEEKFIVTPEGSFGFKKEVPISHW